MNCEVCTKEIKPKDITAGNAFEFFDNIRQKQVAYHSKCYNKKWSATKKPTASNFKAKV